ncbi:phage tail sheath protein [Escherichia coli]|nr:phage tail sheath protein [Escherichia coli]
MTSFNTIPSNTLVPIFYAEMDNQAANTAQDSGASLLIGHANNGAEIVANSLVLMPSADYARQICGAGSQLARMVEAYRQTDPFGELYVIAVPESTGAAATVTLTVTGAATETGTVNVYVGRTRVQAPVTNGDNVATIASSIQDAINAVPTLPFTASSSAGVVTLTARHKGLCGNEIPVSLNYYGFGGGEVLPAGVQIAVATGTAGTGAPVLTGAVAAMADEPFDYIGLPFNDTASVNTLVTEMNDTSGRWSYARQLYGHVYTAKIGTLSELVRELDPRSTTELINRWERLCGLPDECIPAGTQTLRQRQQRLDAKVNLAGGINEDFYLAQLAALGRPDATITRYDKSTFTCSSACTDAVNAPEWRYYWQVNMPATTNTTWMTCGDPCDSALRIWGDTVVECVLNKLCPSHTYVIFKYPE